MSRRWGALSDPNFRVFLAASGASLSGQWLLRTAQSWLVLDLTGSPAALGAVMVAQSLPVTVLALFAGVAIDRFGARRLMVSAQVLVGAQAAITAVLVLTNQVQYWEVLALAAMMGVGSALEFPSRTAIVGELLEPRSVGHGIALYSSLNSAARIVGPGVGGVMIALWGTGACFAVTTVGYLVSMSALLVLRIESRHSRARPLPGAIGGQLISGLQHSFSTPVLAFSMILCAFIGTFAYNWATVLPLLARYALDSGPEGFGTMNIAMGVGSAIGGLVLAARATPSPRLVLAAATIFAALILALSYAPSMAVAIPLLLCTGLASVAFDASTNTLLQREARPEFRGRVLSLYTFLMLGTTPLGATLTGVVADAVDVRLALQVNGGLCLLGALVAAIFLWHAGRARRPDERGGGEYLTVQEGEGGTGRETATSRGVG